MNLLGVMLIVPGLVLLAIGALGAVRLPDFYCRSHAIGVTDTLGTLLVVTGVALTCGWTILTLKMMLLVIFIYIANPTITHVLVRAAYRSGLKPWRAPEDRKHG